VTIGLELALGSCFVDYHREALFLGSHLLYMTLSEPPPILTTEAIQRTSYPTRKLESMLPDCWVCYE